MLFRASDTWHPGSFHDFHSVIALRMHLLIGLAAAGGSPHLLELAAREADNFGARRVSTNSTEMIV